MLSYRTITQSTLLAAAVMLGGCGWLSSMTGSDAMSMVNQLSGAQEVPTATTGHSGLDQITFDNSTNVLTWTVTCSQHRGSATAGHFHGPAMPTANEGVVVTPTGHLSNPIR